MHPTWRRMCLRSQQLVWQASDYTAARTSTCSSWTTRLWQGACNRAGLLLLLLPFACLMWAKGVLLSFACSCICFDMRYTQCGCRPHVHVRDDSFGLRCNTLKCRQVSTVLQCVRYSILILLLPDTDALSISIATCCQMQAMAQRLPSFRLCMASTGSAAFKAMSMVLQSRELRVHNWFVVT